MKVRTYSQQKAGLTRAVNSGDPRKVTAEVARAYAEWDENAWPDDWHRWQRALFDAQGQILRGEIT